MSKKASDFFEEHIEKMVLAIVGIVCIWLLITRVLLSPNYVEYEDKKFSPGNIDNYISEQTKLLEDKLNRKPDPMRAYKLRLGDFTALVRSAIRGIDVNRSLPQPNKVMEASVKRAYRIPLIGEVSEMSVEHIRAVAYVPTEKINEENLYDEAETEANDLDFVTVEAKFDVARLHESFYESFSGENVPEQWCDPCLASPIFAAVQLQRQELLAESKRNKMHLGTSAAGSWSDWQVVPRTRVDHRKKMFEVIEEVEKLPVGGIKVRLLQFDDRQVIMDLLQPKAYKIASAGEEWFPPSLHKKFVRRQQVLEAQEKREARAAEREEREREREGARAERSGRVSKVRTRSVGGVYDEYGTDDFSDGGVPSRKTPTRRTRSERPERQRERGREIAKTVSTIDDIYDGVSEISITEETGLTKMREPLVFWAHDDTVEPGKSYRYRIRLGVFNPISGTNQFSEQDKRFRNRVILWSEFSDVTETVEIPRTLYFFPRQEAAKTVTVTVCRYALGYWYSKGFTVKKGEVIGKVVKSETKEAEREGVTIPETIDYATEAVLVDVIPVNDWSGGKNLRARHYFDMLYSFDGTQIERIPIKTRYWPEKLQAKFNEIKKSGKEPKEPLRDWGSGRRERRRPTPGLEYDESGEEFMDYY